MDVSYQLDKLCMPWHPELSWNMNEQGGEGGSAARITCPDRELNVGSIIGI